MSGGVSVVATDPIAQLADNLRAARISRGLTQEAVANRAGLTLSDVGRVERGERDPGVTVLAKIAYGLGTTPGELLTGVEWEPRPSTASDSDD